MKTKPTAPPASPATTTAEPAALKLNAPPSLDGASLFLAQEKSFSVWIADYWRAALELELFRRELGNKKFFDWLGANFRTDQMDVISDMLQKMKGERGRRILKHHQKSGQFSIQ